jgi:hypothetical protein
MFTNINSKYRVSPEMSQYIINQTNKWLDNKFFNYDKNFNKHPLDLNISNLVKGKYEDKNCPNCYFLLPFVSLISFLAGYKFSAITNNH